MRSLRTTLLVGTSAGIVLVLLVVGLQWSVEAQYDLLGHRDSAPTNWIVLIGAIVGPVPTPRL